MRIEPATTLPFFTDRDSAVLYKRAVKVICKTFGVHTIIAPLAHVGVFLAWSSHLLGIDVYAKVSYSPAFDLFLNSYN